MESIKSEALLNKSTYSSASEHENNSAELPRVKIEEVELDCLNENYTIKCESNLVEQPKIKIEKVDQLVYLNSTYSFDIKQEINNVNIKSELLSEEWHAPIKDEVYEDISSSIKQRLSNFITQETTKRKRSILSTTTRHGICNQCRLCGQFFLNHPDYFLFHWLCYHSNAKCLKRNWFQKRRYSTSRSTRTTQVRNNRTKCKICSKSFLSANKLKRHFCVCIEENRNCDINIKECTGQPAPPSYTYTDRKIFKCDVCLKQFNHKSNFNRHMHLHTGKKPYRCKICSKRFSTKSYLAFHKRTHTGQKRYMCEICSKQFSQTNSLTVHMRTHTGEKPFKCEICSKQFADKSNLTRHVHFHADKKQFKCKTCQNELSTKYDLALHMRTHTGEKPFHCELCSKRFSRKRYLTVHMRTHTGQKQHVCEICSKQFSQANNLVSHMRTHTGEKPFKCEVCLKHFSHKSTLTRHMCTHTGEKPFICELCLKRFSTKSDLTRHMRSH